MTLTIVVPAYNEEKRLGATLKRMLAFFDEQRHPFEIIVVDDGSTDGTAGRRPIGLFAVYRGPFRVRRGGPLHRAACLRLSGRGDSYPLGAPGGIERGVLARRDPDGKDAAPHPNDPV